MRYLSLYLQEGGVVLFFLLTNKGVDRDYQRPSFVIRDSCSVLLILKYWNWHYLKILKLFVAKNI